MGRVACGGAIGADVAGAEFMAAGGVPFGGEGGATADGVGGLGAAGGVAG